MKQCQLLTATNFWKCWINAWSYWFSTQLEKIPWVEKSLGRQHTSKRPSVDAVRACTSLEPFPEAGLTWGRYIYVALQYLSRGLHRMVAQSWAGVCCLQGTKGFFSQTIFQGRHTFSWRISFSALETTCQKASQQLCGIIHAGTSLSSRLGPAHCPTNLWAGGIPGVCLLSASQQGQQLWGSLCLLQAVGQLGTGIDVHWRTGRPGSAVPCLG